jgi:predicted Fe-Mo cluster-binding NifX family protein
MKIALTVWQNRVSPVFDTARRVVLAELADGQLAPGTEESLPEGPAALRVTKLKELGVGVLVCGAISQPLACLIEGANIKLIPFVSGPVDDILQAFSQGTLETAAFGMPGCCGRRRRSQGGRKQCWRE